MADGTDDGLESYSKEQLLHLCRLHMAHGHKLEAELDTNEKITNVRKNVLHTNANLSLLLQGMQSQLRKARGDNGMLNGKIQAFEVCVKWEYLALLIAFKIIVFFKGG